MGFKQAWSKFWSGGEADYDAEEEEEAVAETVDAPEDTTAFKGSTAQMIDFTKERESRSFSRQTGEMHRSEKDAEPSAPAFSVPRSDEEFAREWAVEDISPPPSAAQPLRFPQAQPHGANLCFKPIRDYQAAALAADKLLEGRIVIVNLEDCDKALATRVMDFLGGISYAINAEVIPASRNVFTITPRGIQSEGEFYENDLGTPRRS
ncbi:MAG: cell division protein SepF [Oscillospiraceae bacterium]|jgi:cell division inhibitor SepF|nr:cell division protein SepF [Oscillospiraceae bacterium]